jgi:hypothetical protein
MKIGVEQEFGCYPERLPEEDRTKGVVPDQFRHEIATSFNLKGRGCPGKDNLYAMGARCKLALHYRKRSGN